MNKMTHIFVTKQEFNSIKKHLIRKESKWYYPQAGIYIYLWGDHAN